MLWILLSVCLFLVIAFFVTAYVCYRITFFVPKKYRTPPQEIPYNIIPNKPEYDAIRTEIVSMIDHALTIPYEEIIIISHDGFRLHGKYYKGNDGAPLQLFFHGYRSVGIRDFGGGLQLALQKGHHAILVDQRAQGKSEGTCMTFGILERLDCLAWCNYAKERFGSETPIILVGMSMGSATVLMASELDLPQNVVGIIADCGYSSPKGIIQKVIREDMKLPLKSSYFFLKLGARIYGKFDLESSSATEAVKHTKVPILFIHGDSDLFVPYEMSKANYDACVSKKTFVTVENAGHGICYLVDKEKYTNAVDTFLKSIL